MFVNLIKIFIFFFILYFIYNVVKTILGVKNNFNKAKREYNKKTNIHKDKENDNDKIIELDKDQYKVE